MTEQELRILVKDEMSRRHLLSFMKQFWRKKGSPLKVGLHTRAICDRIDKAIQDYDKGKSSFIIITVPFRHGKSDIVSRYLPAFFIGNHPDDDVMVVTYSGSLSSGFTKFARDIVKTREYNRVFGRGVSKDSAANNNWQLEGGIGVVVGSGIQSGITGKGYNLGILDDYCANRADAESQLIRDKTWDSFRNDFFTRQAPVCITIILATPWHVDDVIGRIKKLTDEKSKSYDPNFQKFDIIKFPAMNGEATVKNKRGEWEAVKYDYLFTPKVLSTGEVIDGRYNKDWYIRQFAALGEYNASALLQCDPTTKSGNLIKVENIKYHDNVADFPNTKYYRVWDLAHTAKQTQKDDPDWTSGTLLTYTKVDGQWHLWIKDVARIRASAGERDIFIRAVSEKDGMGVSIAVESSIDSKDAVNNLQTILNGVRKVIPQKIGIDKVARAGYVEPIFEAGHVHILRGAWNLDWLTEVKEFPSGKHDDQVDNFTAGYFLCCQNNSGQIISGRVSFCS
ncbi:MAG: terminase family protein [Treponema sp.]|nr:terminase family protein [Treponema sp.]